MRVFLLAGAAWAALALGAHADPIEATDGYFETDVSAKDITRISVVGEKLASARKIDEALGPKMSIDIDASTGDAFVTFDGDVVGRAFTVFLTTQSGKTVQAVLDARDRGGQTVLVRLPGSAAAPPPSDEKLSSDDQVPSAAPVDGQTDRHEGYPEILTALVRVMFNDVDTAGVERHAVIDRPKIAGAFELQVIKVFTVGDLKGTVLSLQNKTAVAQALNAKTFLVPGVLASSVSNETVEPGQLARVYIVETASQ